MQYKVYTTEQVEEVKRLFEDGKNKCEISRILNIPRATLTKWIHPKYIRKTDNPRKSYVPVRDFAGYLDTIEKQKAYSFILAVYLCDGHISRYKTFRAPCLRLFNDSKYPFNAEEWKRNLQMILPENSVNLYRKKNGNCNIVLVYSRKLTDLFPQYGDGRKHSRKLDLIEWQKEIIENHPQEFIRGCIQSDGCIYSQTIGKYTYKRYAFSNMSEDIIDFFLLALSFVGIKKEKWQNKTNKKFVIQNFSKTDSVILEKIIPNKE